MGKFKKGDKVTGIKEGFFKGQILIVDRHESITDMVYFEPHIGGWYSHRFELIPPAKPTGFEVGKKYKYKTGGLIYTVEYILSNGNAATTTHAKDGTVIGAILYNFNKVIEVIPPPPEEWRIVYKDNMGVHLGVHPFISDSEARNSTWWGKDAFKTIRVDQ